MTPVGEKTAATLAVNRKARHDYHIVERIEAGIELRGTEVKSMRAGQTSLAGGFARAREGEIFLYNVTVPAYEHGNRFNHEPDRPRRLLLHRREIVRLGAQIEQKGCVLVPLALVLRRGRVKVELGLCRGKRLDDRRETLRRRTAERETEREIAGRARGRAGG